MTQNERLIQYLSTGRTLTAAQARSRFGVRNLRARVNDLRNDGFCVYTNRNSNGVTYRMGTPSRAIVAAAYNKAGSALFSR
jgi:hypothetical protein